MRALTNTEAERAYRIVAEFVEWNIEIGPCPITPLNKPWFQRLCAMAERMAMLESDAHGQRAIDGEKQ